MNQFNQLCKYLDKLGIPYEKYTFNKDKVFKDLTSVSVPYKDANGYEARIQVDKSITVRKEAHGIKDYVVANLYYIELEDGFVDPNDCSPKKELFVMDAWEAARYIGAEYFGKDPEDIEPMLESKSKKKCSMQKKMESLKNEDIVIDTLVDDIREKTASYKTTLRREVEKTLYNIGYKVANDIVNDYGITDTDKLETLKHYVVTESILSMIGYVTNFMDKEYSDKSLSRKVALDNVKSDLG